jgi:SNF2 family DNA or RNA helicase
VNSIIQNVLEKIPEIDFPIPKAFELIEYTVKPINVLKLFSINNNARNIHIMQLSFLYGELSFKSNSIASYNIVTHEDKTLKVIRDIEEETQSKAIIETLGFLYEGHPLLEGYISIGNNSQQEAIERWRVFREDFIPNLRDEGWIIEIDENFEYNFEYVESVALENHDSHSNNWFELSLSVDIGNRKLALLPIVAPLLEEFDSVDDLPEKLNLALEDGGYLHIDAKEIKPILKTIFELFDKKVGNKLVIKPFDAHLLDPDADIEWKNLKELRALAQKLKNFQGITHIEPSSNLNASLRDYQGFGLDWLNFLHEFKFGGILADDMGLGKTVQTLAFLQVLKERGELHKPTLIVMPTSLIGNWKNEIAKFTENLSFLELYGIDRAKKFAKISEFDIILTTYSLAQRDAEKYTKEKFEYIVLDEAQKIKNPNTKLAIAVKSFHSEHKLALSGTPIENHLGELWSIFDFLMSGFLDNLKTFKSFFQSPIEKEYDMTKRALLNKKIAPFILRRTKDEVVHELPPKTEIIKRATFDAKQAKLYENIRITMESKVRETIKGKGLSRSHITILDALLKLRQVCCSPELLKLEEAKKVKTSAKLEMFLELLESLHEENKKVLVFSQFTSMLSIMEREIKKRNYTYTKLTGSTRKREEAIEKFTKGNANIFLISLKAGGIGLNLVEADTVIHYDPWWNPAVENQATDRAYRIGQDKAVFVYKLIVEGSIEEKILQLQERKKALQDGIYKGNEDKQDKFDGGELVELLKI